MGGFEARKSAVETQERGDATEAATQMDELQPPEKMAEGSLRHTESGDVASAA